MDAKVATPNVTKAEQPVVLHVITGLGVGGAERVVLELSKKLGERGWRTVIVALDGNRALLEQYRDLPNPIYSLEVRRNSWAIFRLLPNLVTILRKHRPSIIHAHMFHGLLAALLCRVIIPSAKIVFTSHSFAGFAQLRGWTIRETRRFRAVDIIFAHGQHIALNAGCTEIIPNGVTVPDSRRSPTSDTTRPYVFISVGRLVAPKDPISLITALAGMRHRNCHLWLVGDGPLRSDVEAMITQSELSDRVKLFGIRSDATELVSKADCFVMASRWEGLPLALLEAGAVGLPVIAPPVGAIPQILGDGCGYIAEASQLTQVMDSVIDSPQEANARGVKLRERIISCYTLENMAIRHQEVYSRLAQRREYPAHRQFDEPRAR